MDAAAELGRNPVSTRFSLSMEMSRLTRDGAAEPVSRDQNLRRERGQGTINFPCSANHEQDWRPYPVDTSLAICDDHTYIYIYIYSVSVRESWKKFPDAARNEGALALALLLIVINH